MKLLKEPGSMDTPFIPAKFLSVMLKASSILKPGEENNISHVESMEKYWNPAKHRSNFVISASC